MIESKKLRAYFDELRDPEPNANGLAVVQAELLLDIRDLLTERLPVPISEDTAQGDELTGGLHEEATPDDRG